MHKEIIWLYLFGALLFISQVSMDGYLNFSESGMKAEKVYQNDLQQLMQSHSVVVRLATDSMRIVNLHKNNATKNQFNELAIAERRVSAKAYDKSVSKTDSTIGAIIQQQEQFLQRMRKPIEQKYQENLAAVSIDTWAGRLNGISIYLIMPALSLVLGNLAAKQPTKAIFKNSPYAFLSFWNWQHVMMLFSYYAEFVSCQFTQKALAIKLEDTTISFYYAAAFFVCSPTYYFFATKRIEILKSNKKAEEVIDELEETGSAPMNGYEKEIKVLALLFINGKKAPHGEQNRIAEFYGKTALEVSKDKHRLAKKLRKEMNLKNAQKSVKNDEEDEAVEDFAHHFEKEPTTRME